MHSIRLLFPAIFSLIFLFPKFVSAQSESLTKSYFYAEKVNGFNNNSTLMKFKPGSVISIKLKGKPQFGKRTNRMKGVITGINDSIIFVKTIPVPISEIMTVRRTYNPLIKPGVTATTAGLGAMICGIAVMSNSYYNPAPGMLLSIAGYCCAGVGSNLLIAALIWEIVSPGYSIKKGAKFYIKTEFVSENP